MEISFKHFYERASGKTDFSVNGVGVREVMPPGIIDRPRGTGDSLLMFFYESQRVNIEKSMIEIPAGSMIYWEACGHYYGRIDTSWSHSWIHFDGYEAIKIMHHAGIKPYQVITPPVELLEKLLIGIDQEMQRHVPDKIIVKDRFEIMIREIARASGQESIRIPEKLLMIRRYIEDHYHKRITLESLAKKFAMSRPHLSAEFKRWFGSAPVEYQIGCRLREAERLLMDRNLRVSDVAAKVGWSDTYYFSKIFKKYRKKSPSKIRNS